MRNQRHLLLVLSTLLAATCPWFAGWSLAASGSPGPQLIYSKTLKGSVPEYVRVTVNADGSGTYEARKLDEPPSSRPLRLSASTTQRLFALSAALGNFESIELESHRNVANLGLKTLGYRASGQLNRVEFNYTLNRTAQGLVDLFERISSVEQHVVALEFAMKYDHLALPQELLQIQIDLNNKALAEPELMVPALKQIVANSHFLHLAQVRAENILQRIQPPN
jgi:hypothetical protein